LSPDYKLNFKLFTNSTIEEVYLLNAITSIKNRYIYKELFDIFILSLKIVL